MGFSRGDAAVLYLGINTLLPYNSLINAQPYFDKYPFSGLHFPFTSMIVYSLGLCSSQIWLTFKGDGFSISSRMAVALYSGIFTCAVLFGITLLCGGATAKAMYVPCLVTVAVMSLSNSILQTGLFGFSGTISQEMSAAAMTGMGVSGIVSLGVSLLVQSIQGTMQIDGDSSGAGMVVALVMFAICAFHTMSCCWVYFVYLRVRLPETAAALANLEEQRASPRHDARSPSITLSAVSCENAHLPTSTGLEIQEEATSSSSAGSSCLQTWQRLRPVLLEVRPQALNVWSVFFVTMTVFPGVMIHWLPGETSPFRTDKQLYDTMLIGCFQFGDVVGRYSAGAVRRYIAPQRLWILVLLRFIFIPLFMLGQRSPSSCALWGSDAGRFLLCIVFAVSNGLAANLAMMFGPESVSAVEKREVAGIAMSAVMVTGIFCGTMLAFATQIGVPVNATYM